MFIDNFYTSVELLGDLLDKGTYCVGTARSHRKHFLIDIVPDSSSASIGSFWFAVGSRCGATASATTTAAMEETESDAVSSTVCPVTAL